MEVVNIIKEVKSFFSEVLKMECRVLSTLKAEEGWKAVCEVLVDEEYTRKKGLGDIVEIFEVMINENGKVTGYDLKMTKRRASFE